MSKEESEITEEEIRGRSFRVCQYHYDFRKRRGLVYTDEIVEKNDCAFCNFTK